MSISICYALDHTHPGDVTITPTLALGEIARVRRQVYAIDDVEFEEGVRCRGALIFDHHRIPTRLSASALPSPACCFPGRTRWGNGA
jgi:DNA-binding IclR family transcriptional regulator